MKNQSSQNDYANSVVPENAGVGSLEIALVVIGGTIGFAVFIVAARIGGSLGASDAAKAFIIGSIILGILGATTSYVGAKARLSTYLLTQHTFGKRGAKFSNTAIAISLVGWYGVICNSLGQAGQQMLAIGFDLTIPAYIPVLIASILMVLVTLSGFKGIDRLALWLVPIMFSFIAFAAYKSTAMGTLQTTQYTTDFTMSSAISAVVGSYIAGGVIQPDYSRFARNKVYASIAVFVALGIAFPAIQFLSAMPSLAFANPDFIAVMSLLGLAIPAFFLLLFGAWSSNVLCLYSAGLSLATVTKRWPLQKIILGVGVVGTAIAFIPAQNYLINLLVVLGIVIPPLGAIYCLDAIVIKKFEYEQVPEIASYHFTTLLSWLIGILAGFLCHFQLVGISNISSIDSLLGAAFTFVILHSIKSLYLRLQR